MAKDKESEVSSEEEEFERQLADVFNSETSRTPRGVRGGRSAPKGYRSTSSLAKLLGRRDPEQDELDRSISNQLKKRE